MSYSTETIALLNSRVSIRKFKTDPVPEDLVQEILNAAFRAPTSSNIQSYSVIIVKDPETRKSLAELTGNQKHVIEAPIFLAFCADLTRIESAMARQGDTIVGNNLEIGLVSSIDASLVGMSAYLAAESVGLKGVMIGAMRNNAVIAASLLGLPQQVYCVYGMCLGWPDEAPAQKPRMDYSTIVHYERYGALKDNRDLYQTLDDYDESLAIHYKGIGKSTTTNSWTHDMGKKFSPQLREKLRQELKEQGFDFG